MKRPRWHDVILGLAICGIAASGVWAFWGEEVRRSLGGKEAVPVQKAPAGAAS
jgi:hypothetical protein